MIRQEARLIGKITSSANLSAKIIIPEYVNTEAYKGDYTVIPKIDNQELETKNYLMKDNVHIDAIPFHKFSNVSGDTVVIGGIF